jgi:hypothetical protein
VAGQAAQMRRFFVAADAVIEERDEEHPRRHPDRRGRPRMHLLVKFLALRVVGGEAAVHEVILPPAGPAANANDCAFECGCAGMRSARPSEVDRVAE